MIFLRLTFIFFAITYGASLPLIAKDTADSTNSKIEQEATTKDEISIIYDGELLFTDFIDKVKSNPKLLHNTPEKKEQRRQMQCGERPKGCEYCWKIEDIGRDAISDRVYKSKIFSNNALDDAFKSDPNANWNLKTLDCLG